MNIFNEIIVIGLGGNFILRYFLGFFLSLFPEKLLKLIDGKNYKAKNIDHEHFDSLENKAFVSKKMLLRDFPSLKVIAIPYFIGKEASTISRRASDIIRDGSVIFLCVDNNVSKKLISQYCSALRNILLISMGIEGADVQVQIYLRLNGKDFTPPIHKTNIFIMNPNDELPDQQKPGCDETIERGRPNVFSLMMASALSLAAYYSVMEAVKSKKGEAYEVRDIFFNVDKLRMREVHLNS